MTKYAALQHQLTLSFTLQAGAYCNGNVMILDGGFLANHAGA